MAVWLPSQILLNKVILVWKPLLPGVSAGAASSRKWKQDRKRIVGPRLPPGWRQPPAASWGAFSPTALGRNPEVHSSYHEVFPIFSLGPNVGGTWTQNPMNTL